MPDLHQQVQQQQQQQQPGQLEPRDDNNNNNNNNEPNPELLPDERRRGEMNPQDPPPQPQFDNIPNQHPDLNDGEGGDMDLRDHDNDNDNDNDFDNGFENELPPGEGEIQFALDELLGLRGVTHLLRNAWLLLAFNCVYIGLFASFPFMVGVSICRFIGQSSWVKAAYAILKWLIPESIVLASQVTTLSSTSEDALQFSDLVLVVLGYASLFFMIFALSESLYTLREVFSPSFLTNSILGLVALANVVKVGLLLLVRVFILPVILGVVVLICANSFLGYGTNDWAIFISSNVVGSVSLSWVAGISYMVSTTLTVLQLREILHPDILARNIRPQEPHFQLLMSLMYESTFTHCRRVLTSMMVYLSLLLIFVYAPMYIARNIQDYCFSMSIVNSTSTSSFAAGVDIINITATTNTTTTTMPSPTTTSATSSVNFPLYFNYYVPQIQIPFELAFAHLTFLTLLDRHKDKIGRFLFAWLCKMGDALGLSHMLLPYNMTPFTQRATLDMKFYTSKDGRRFVGTPEKPFVRSPLVRPPPRWDDQNGRGIGRWAWGTEPKSYLEMHVAPQITPSFWMLRLVVLAFVTWVVIGVMVLSAVFFPLGVGRGLLYGMKVPQGWIHDPCCYALGAAFFWMFLSLLSTVNANVLAPYVQVIRKMSFPVALLVAKLSIGWLIAVLGIGVTIRTCLSTSPLLQEVAWPTVSLTLGTYLKGSILANAFVGQVYYGYLEKLLSFLDYRAPDVMAGEEVMQGVAVTRLVETRDPTIQAVSTWASTLRELLHKPTFVRSPENENVWEIDTERLNRLWELLVKPLLFSSVLHTMVVFLLVHAAYFGLSSSVGGEWNISSELFGSFNKSHIESLLVCLYNQFNSLNLLLFFVACV